MSWTLQLVQIFCTSIFCSLCWCFFFKNYFCFFVQKWMIHVFQKIMNHLFIITVSIIPAFLGPSSCSKRIVIYLFWSVRLCSSCLNHLIYIQSISRSTSFVEDFNTYIYKKTILIFWVWFMPGVSKITFKGMIITNANTASCLWQWYWIDFLQTYLTTNDVIWTVEQILQNHTFYQLVCWWLKLDVLVNAH